VDGDGRASAADLTPGESPRIRREPLLVTLRGTHSRLPSPERARPLGECETALAYTAAPMTYAEFGTGQVVWAFFWLALFLIQLFLVILVFSDIFRSSDLSGWGKALWTIFVILVPYVGIFIYLIVRGDKIEEHAIWRGHRPPEVPAEGSTSQELARLGDLRAQGLINESEYERARARALFGDK
jgi:hypothetical protein